MTAASIGSRRAPPGTRALRGLAWVTWRQHRLGIAGVLTVLGGLGLFLVFDGLAIHHAYTSLGLDTCGTLSGPTCESQLAVFQQEYYPLIDHLPHLLMLLPGLIGVFVGAPLVARELESGTFRFAWTQGRSRVQWIVAKLVLLGLAVTALALAFSALFTWWYGPFDTLSGRMSTYGAYEVSGLVFAGRTLLGFSLGALLGVVVRRTLPAMAATGIGWLAVSWASITFLRPSIRQPVTIPGMQAKGPVPGSGGIPLNADVVSNWLQNASGRHVDFHLVFNQATAANGGVSPTPEALQAWMTQHHISPWVSYLPNSWFWHFQAVEASAYAVLALLLAVATVLAVRRQAT